MARPVGRNLRGIQQIQVRPRIGPRGARFLRGVLRHDPSAIMGGKTRDRESAAMAIRAARLGRLVRSTPHPTGAGAGAGESEVKCHIRRDCRPAF